MYCTKTVSQDGNPGATCQGNSEAFTQYWRYIDAYDSREECYRVQKDLSQREAERQRIAEHETDAPTYTYISQGSLCFPAGVDPEKVR